MYDSAKVSFASVDEMRCRPDKILVMVRSLMPSQRRPQARSHRAVAAMRSILPPSSSRECAASAHPQPIVASRDAMNDETNPPGFRGEMAKAAAPYVHSKAPVLSLKAS
jgi:hypothetical protein